MATLKKTNSPLRREKKEVMQKSEELKTFLACVKNFDIEEDIAELEEYFGDGKATETLRLTERTCKNWAELSTDIFSLCLRSLPSNISKSLRALIEKGDLKELEVARRSIAKKTKTFKGAIPTPYQHILAQVREMEDPLKVRAFKQAAATRPITEEDLGRSIYIKEVSSRLSEYCSPTSGIYSSSVYKTFKIDFWDESVEKEVESSFEAYSIGS